MTLIDDINGARLSLFGELLQKKGRRAPLAIGLVQSLFPPQLAQPQGATSANTGRASGWSCYLDVVATLKRRVAAGER
jgi:hypothetical protein